MGRFFLLLLGCTWAIAMGGEEHMKASIFDMR